VAHDQEVREILKCHRPRGAAPPVSLSRRHLSAFERFGKWNFS
jgi:hypothetical protein